MIGPIWACGGGAATNQLGVEFAGNSFTPLYDFLLRDFLTTSYDIGAGTTMFWLGNNAGLDPCTRSVVGVHPHEVAVADRRLQEEIWGAQAPLGPETLIASPYAPGGVLVPTEGGYIFNGRWGYSSGNELCQ